MQHLVNFRPKDFEFEPAFSPDGKSIVYVSWNDETLGSIMEMNLSSGQATKLTTKKAIYRTPAYSPDGQQIVYRKEGGNYHQGFLHTKKPGLYLKNSNDKSEGEMIKTKEN